MSHMRYLSGDEVREMTNIDTNTEYEVLLSNFFALIS